MSHGPDDPRVFFRALLCFVPAEAAGSLEPAAYLLWSANVAVTSNSACDEGTMNLQHARTDLLEFPPETQAKLRKQVYVCVRRHSIYSTANCRRSCSAEAPPETLPASSDILSKPTSCDGPFSSPQIICVVRLQIEFYFSDSNLPRDVFMADQIAADPEV